ncbi:MAG: hypothetical protein SGJ24_14450 [Chloroflexota bacterium]|nr:hypothetical protein [Chloroflexota bacterium]
MNGEIGFDRFSMEDDSLVIDGAEDIAYYTSIGYMPPYPPGGDSPHYLYDRSLTAEQIAVIAAWAEAGAPAGDPGVVVPIVPIVVAPDVRPDLTLQMAEPYLANTEIEDDYRCFILDPQFTQDTTITSYDVIPGSTTLVHHAILFPGMPAQRAQAASRDALDEAPGWECYGGTGLDASAQLGAEQLRSFRPLLVEVGGFEGFYRLLQADDAAQQLTAALAVVDSSGELNALVEAAGGIDAFIDMLRPYIGEAGLVAPQGAGGGGIIGGWVPGTTPTHFPIGTGKLIPAGGFIVLQMHYHPGAEVESDRTQLVMQLETDAAFQALRTVAIVAPVEIPCPEGAAGEGCSRDMAMRNVANPRSDGLLRLCGQTLADYADQQAENAIGTCDYSAPFSGWGVAILSHQHTLGATTRTVLNPDAPDAQVLIDIPEWDFDWQGNYFFVEPVWIDRGDVIRITCTWDNSLDDDNPEPRYVVWGEGTDDEMCLNYLTVLPAEPGTPAPVSVTAVSIGS